ncbi:uncharacterized protein LOC108711752 isoform X6 [Xenopus laevis]|uniref:Uncharacterized protein LOC108711752 isoform X6 n=1 Tax=Xenopus laevis TaxID=8355 RepID=A0A8J1N2M4_XENLA|nr:uncharacterized protein LOC108711752 isoform X6 [Xenopus laevis]
MMRGIIRIREGGLKSYFYFHFTVGNYRAVVWRHMPPSPHSPWSPTRDTAAQSLRQILILKIFMNYRQTLYLKILLNTGGLNSEDNFELRTLYLKILLNYRRRDAIQDDCHHLCCSDLGERIPRRADCCARFIIRDHATGYGRVHHDQQENLIPEGLYKPRPALCHRKTSQRIRDPITRDSNLVSIAHRIFPRVDYSDPGASPENLDQRTIFFKPKTETIHFCHNCCYDFCDSRNCICNRSNNRQFHLP